METNVPSVQVAHVLFLDVVRYSCEYTPAQGRLLERLNAAVTATSAFAEARARQKPERVARQKPKTREGTIKKAMRRRYFRNDP